MSTSVDNPILLTLNCPPLFVVVCFVISFLGCYTATQLTEQIRISQSQPSRFVGSRTMFFLHALAFGGVSTWIMHILSLSTSTLTLPDETPVSIRFASGMTSLSLVLVIVTTVIGTYVASRDRWFYKSKVEIAEGMADVSKELSLRQIRKSNKLIHIMLTRNLGSIAVGGFITGGGFCAMHYVGTLGMIFAGKLNYNAGIVAGSSLIGLVGATAAYWILFRFLALYPEKELYRIVCAMVMSIAICGMHFTGCAGAQFLYTGIPQSTLTITITAQTTIITSVLVGLAFLWIVLMIVVGDLRAYFYSRASILNSVEYLLKSAASASQAAGHQYVNIDTVIQRYEQFKKKHEVRIIAMNPSYSQRSSKMPGESSNAKKRFDHLVANLSGKGAGNVDGSGHRISNGNSHNKGSQHQGGVLSSISRRESGIGHLGGGSNPSPMGHSGRQVSHMESGMGMGMVPTMREVREQRLSSVHESNNHHINNRRSPPWSHKSNHNSNNSHHRLSQEEGHGVQRLSTSTPEKNSAKEMNNSAKEPLGRIIEGKSGSQKSDPLSRPSHPRTLQQPHQQQPQPQPQQPQQPQPQEIVFPDSMTALEVDQRSQNSSGKNRQSSPLPVFVPRPHSFTRVTPLKTGLGLESLGSDDVYAPGPGPILLNGTTGTGTVSTIIDIGSIGIKNHQQAVSGGSGSVGMGGSGSLGGGSGSGGVAGGGSGSDRHGSVSTGTSNNKMKDGDGSKSRYRSKGRSKDMERIRDVSRSDMESGLEIRDGEFTSPIGITDLGAPSVDNFGCDV